MSIELSTEVRSSERGSVLMLFPAAFLIVLVLGAIAVDSGVAFLRQRDLAAAAGAAANDAIAVAIDSSLTREGDEIRIDPVALERVAITSLERRGVLDGLLERPEIVFIPPDRVEVRLVAEAHYVIAPALPGQHDSIIVRATGTARLAIDDR